MQNNRKVGNHYEQMAAQYLSDKGYRIVAVNYRIRQAEIDIIAYDNNCLVFVEVKYRKNTLNGHPFEAVTPAKIRKICRAALSYLQIHHLLIDETKMRFDVVGIIGTEIQHLKHAFDYVS